MIHEGLFDPLLCLPEAGNKPSISDSKESACNAGIPGSIPRVGNIPWRREWLPTPAFLPGEFHGQRSLVGYNPWSHKESEKTEQLTLSLSKDALPVHISRKTSLSTRQGL